MMAKKQRSRLSVVGIGHWSILLGPTRGKRVLHNELFNSKDKEGKLETKIDNTLVV